jgi:NADH-quinone oxidoreductase subunit C
MTSPDEQERPQDDTAKEDVAPPEAAMPGALEKGAAESAPTAEEVPPETKLDDPVTTGALPNDPAASTEKTAEAAAPAPEGAQPSGDAAAPAAKPAAKVATERPARPAKEAEPKEAPRVTPPAGSINEVLAAVLPDITMKPYVVPSLPGDSVAVEVARDDVPALLTACRDDARLDLKYLRSLSGIDWQEEGLEVVYHLASIEKKHTLTVKTRVTYDDPMVPSVASIYPAADWHERETRDMFGIHFEGHWNLVPLLLPEDMTDHFPLRKENPLQEIEEWQGENLREGAGEGDE